MTEDRDLSTMSKYVLLADRLQDRIDNQQTKEAVAEMGHILKETIVNHKHVQKNMQELERRKEEFYKRFDTKEEAEECMRKNAKIQHSVFEPYVASASAALFGFYACLAACFSREVSKAFLRKKDYYNKLGRNVAKIIKLDKEVKQLQDLTIRQLAKNEFKEAELIDTVREKAYVDDETAYDIVKQPELLIYALLENMKNKYAPDLEKESEI